jgi:hypothetical protein
VSARQRMECSSVMRLCVCNSALPVKRPFECLIREYHRLTLTSLETTTSQADVYRGRGFFLTPLGCLKALSLPARKHSSRHCRGLIFLVSLAYAQWPIEGFHSGPILSNCLIRKVVICDAFPSRCNLYCFLWVLTQLASLEFSL